MSVNNTANKISYDIIEGVDKYTIPFIYWRKSDITAYVINIDGELSLLTLDVDYTVNIPNGTTGTLVRLSDWSMFKTLVIVRKLDLTQETVYTNNTKLDAKTIERDFDRTVAKIIQLQEQIDRSIKLSVGDEQADLSLPQLADRRNKLLGFDSTGKTLEMVASSDIEGLLDLIEQYKDLTLQAKEDTLKLKDLVRTSYQEFVGDGVETGFTINHNLNTRDIMVSVWYSSNYSLQDKDYEIVIIDENSITIDFSIVYPVDGAKINITTNTTTEVRGLNSYTHIAYSNSYDGITEFSLTNSTDKAYLGVYTDNLEVDSLNPSDYTWIRTRGEQGEKGSQGEGALSVKIVNSDGIEAIYAGRDIDTTLYCKVYSGQEDITDLISASKFYWKRVSEAEGTADEVWNNSSKAINRKEIEINDTDTIGRTVFFCEVEI